MATWVKYSTDYFDTSTGYSHRFSGVSIHAQALLTLFDLNGLLQPLVLEWSLLLTFCIFFISEYLLDILYGSLGIESDELRILFNITLLSFVLITISAVIFQYAGYWYNWIIPVVMNQVFDAVKKLNKYWAGLLKWKRSLSKR